MQNGTELHVVLGGAGAIGQAVINELTICGKNIRAVELSTEVDNVPTVQADVLDLAETKKAISGATHVYMCVGLPYNASLWETVWPQLTKNLIAGCEVENAKLIFFDNVYMYGPPPLPVPFDENTEQNPVTRKGKARKIIADMLLEAHISGRIQVVIARSADFYGPQAVNSMFYISFLENILKGKNPQWLGKRNQLHTFANTTDNGRAMVTLALDDSAYGEVWHLPTEAPITPEEMLASINAELGMTYKLQCVPRFVFTILSLFVPVLKEVKEMIYQFDMPYHISAEKFRQKYPDFETTSYRKGIHEMIQSFR